MVFRSFLIKLTKFVLIPAITALFLNFFINWFSAPQLSMNLISDTEFSRKIAIENRGDNVVGARVIIYVPQTYIDNKLVTLNLESNIPSEPIGNWRRYQLDINAPIIHMRNIHIGNIGFKSEEEASIYYYWLPNTFYCFLVCYCNIQETFN